MKKRGECVSTLKCEAFLTLCESSQWERSDSSAIGLLGEKRLHGLLKRWVSPDMATHEQPVSDKNGAPTGLVADVLAGERIFEIQTGKLYPLLKKVARYLEETEYGVTVIHPLFWQKHVCWVEAESGEVTSRHASPLHETPLRVLYELKPFLPYLGTPRFTLCLPLLSVEEFRLLDGWGKGGKRGSHRVEVVPTGMSEICTLHKKEDYAALFPPQFAFHEFTAAEFGKACALRTRKLYGALSFFEVLGVIQKCGKRGRATLYCRV